MHLLLSLNWVAIIVSTVVYFLIGYLWYSPVLFANTWAKETGVKMGGSKMPVLPMIGEFVSSFLFAVGIAVVATIAKSPGIKGGILTGLLVIITFVIPANSGTWFFKNKPLLFTIESGYQAIGALVMAVILNLWK